MILASLPSLFPEKNNGRVRSGSHTMRRRIISSNDTAAAGARAAILVDRWQVRVLFADDAASAGA